MPGRIVPSRWAAVAAVAVVVAIASPAAGQSSDVPHPGSVVFSLSDVIPREGGGGSFVPRGLDLMSPDGSGRRTLTTPEDGSYDEQQAWSPDGRTLAFTRVTTVDPPLGPSTRHRRVLLADPSTGQVVDLAAGKGAAWSPDGRRFAWVRPAGEVEELVVAEVEPSTSAIATIDVEDARVLVAAPVLSAPAWSALGTHLAYVRRDLGDTRESLIGDVWVTDLRGDARQVTHGIDVPSYGHAVSWSPAEESLAVSAFVTQPDGGRLEAAVVVPLDGRPPVHLAPGGSIDWAPDGRLLAVSSRYSGGQLWLVAPDGQIVLEPRLPGQYFRGGVAQARWYPDGSSLLMAGEAETMGNDLYRLDDDGGFTQLTTDHRVRADAVATVAPGATVRHFGDTRVTTSVSLSRAGFDTADTVVLARSTVYADGLVASPLASSLGGPVLLTPTAGLHPEVADEIRRLGATSAVLIGGRDAIGPGVEAQLADAGVTTVERVVGEDRFEVSAAVAERLGGHHAFVVEGWHTNADRGWPDAVAVSGLAAMTRSPILLVTRDSLSVPVLQTLMHGSFDHLTIIGGQAAVSEQLERTLRTLASRVDRIAGEDRYETSAELADVAAALGADTSRAAAVSGRDWPDAVTAGANLGTAGTPILLVDDRAERETATSRWFSGHAGRIGRVDVVGGRGALPPSVVTDLERRLAARS